MTANMAAGSNTNMSIPRTFRSPLRTRNMCGVTPMLLCRSFGDGRASTTNQFSAGLPRRPIGLAFEMKLRRQALRRREFITLVGAAAAAWPLAARAQQPNMLVIGFLATRGRDDDPQLLAAFRRGLNEFGYVEGQNVTLQYRFAENQYFGYPNSLPISSGVGWL